VKLSLFKKLRFENEEKFTLSNHRQLSAFLKYTTLKVKLRFLKVKLRFY
jgi:hypothetical protein